MKPAPKIIVASGIEPKLSDQEEFSKMARECGDFVTNKLNNFFLDLIQQQSYALEKLEEWTPTERLLTLKEAAAYIKFEPRTLNSWCSGKSPRVQFCKLGGKLRFRKVWLDAVVDNGSVKPRQVVKL